MGNKIMLMGDISSFLGNAISSNLKTSGYETVFVKADVDEVNRVKEDVSVIILYLGDFVEKNSEVLFYIKDLCMENDKLVFLVGYEEEIKHVQNIFSKQLISGSFPRPLNVKLLAEQIKQMAEQQSSKDKLKHILVVDDSGVMLRTIKDWLSSKYRVSMANSGMSAITFLANNKPDLILLDYEMPICTGPQVMEMIKAEPTTSNIPIIFLTAKGDKESVMKVLSLKPDGYLLKTMKPDEIISSIDAFFENKRIQQHLL